MKKILVILVCILSLVFFNECNINKPRICDELVYPNPEVFINIYDGMDINEAKNILKDVYKLTFNNGDDYLGYNDGKCNYTKNDSLFVLEYILIQPYYNDCKKFYEYTLTFSSNSIEEINKIYNEILLSYYSSDKFLVSKNDEFNTRFDGELYKIYISRINTNIDHVEYIDSNTGNKIVSGYIYPNYPKLNAALPINAKLDITFNF